MISLEINGENYDSNFKKITVKRSIEDMAGVFSFDASALSTTPFPIKRGSSAKAKIGDFTIANGFAENVSINYSPSNHSISIKGRDKTCDVIDSSLIGSKDFNTPISLGKLIETILSNNSIEGVSVINLVEDLEPFGAGELLSAKQSQKIYEFIEGHAKKRQVLLTTDGNGNIVITRATETDRAIGRILNDPSQPQSSNTLSSSTTYNESERYNIYTTQSQLNPSALASGNSPIVKNEEISEQSGSAVDPEVRASRNLIVTAEHSSNSQTSESRSLWEKNIRKGKSEEYEVTLQGFYQDLEKTQIWVPNQLVKIKDVFADLDTERLIKSVEYNYDVDGGSTTKLSCVPIETFTVQAEIDEFEAQNKNEGGNLT